ncbi:MULTISPECIES: putative sporulation protein YtxC [Clostridium]|uniref:Putative sporulation protein YtxC n=1 Tax=Clostridium botulinum TaxID=1491 RepID=A0A6B4JJN3_CLOBO|nr:MULTISPECIES: putative sporulation protein YtxC [Clostridium]ACD52047.1 putative sporulation protein YtxC [Clostridium botulinum E3 str. Alaska E43]AJF30116.1 sporulation protein [Clostridium botulinum]AJF33179.1 sporulation protein [Clostridium botulinum]EES48431.1 putative sporulation protein YtxC [Clostridium botulinum E1 str. 'BoNT E Beluga']KIL06718.1 sporulation protein [Clostridium botulinum]
MLVLKLAYNDELDFVGELQDLRELLKKKNILIGLVESIEDTTHIIKIICEEEHYNEKVKDIINLYVSNILYKIVIENYREKEMLEFLTENYFFLKQDEIFEIEDDIVKVLECEGGVKDGNSIYYLNKMNGIIEEIKDCIKEKQEININGFITFRMKKLRGDIEKIIQKVVENYIVEKEYKEFVKLLKYFVDIQDYKIELIDIFIEDNGDYRVTDNYETDLLKTFKEEFSDCKKMSDVSTEDILISGLITNTPKKIIIHNKENSINREFLETLNSVFGDRVEYCNRCMKCENKKIIIKSIDTL